MPTLTVFRISEILDGKLCLTDQVGQRTVSTLSIDSRTIFDPSTSLFFAIKSERNDGHRYVLDLERKGVRAFVISDFRPEFGKLTNCSFIIVHNTLFALQKLASWNRSQYHIPVIAITGSNGKTIIKEWLYDLLQAYKVIRSPKSYNSQLGVPLSVWNMGPNDELAIFEAGISKPEEMAHLQEIIQPTIGILTNIGDAHQENFTSKVAKLAEKLKLFKSCKTLIYCKDHSIVDDNITYMTGNSSVRLINWSFIDPNADLTFKIEKNGETTDLTTEVDGKRIRITLPFTDAANLENAGHCLAFLISQKMIDSKILSAFSKLQPVAMRLEMKEGINNCILINDYYNSDIHSLQIALAFLDSHVKVAGQCKTLILSDIRQSGIADERLYLDVAKLVELNKIDRLIGVGNGIRNQAHFFAQNSFFFETTDQFLEGFHSMLFQKEAILIKGARDFHFERISSALQKKSHQTALEININTLIENLNVFRSKILPDTLVMVMVKAFSYGSGMAEIARILQYHKVDYLAVAVADEGVELRQAGIDLPIVVMNPEEHSFENMIEFRLEPNIYSIEIFESFRKVIQQNAVDHYPVHIKLDTGMHRLGFDSEHALEVLAEKLMAQKQLMVRSVFSHLAGADEAIHDEFTKLQVKRFVLLSDILTRKLPYKVYRHLLNSAGIERFPQFQFEMVRLGIGLYGISVLDDNNIRSISRLKTNVSQVRKIAAGETVGYSRKGIISENAEIAVLPVGYADGYDRRFSNGTGHVFVKGNVVPVVGNICMDMCMIDVTGLNVSVGDEVELMGDRIKLNEMAQAIGTIPYEILTGISQRVKRVYLQE
jgi:alanine racemase